MGYQTKEFLETLFNPGEWLCFSNTGYDTLATPNFSKADGANYFTINPLRPYSTRADANVACFRNILFEIDGMSLAEQANYIEGELALPFTTKVFSGGKSYHYILSLDEPLSDIESYRELVANLYTIASLADPTCRNPSRFSRVGGVARQTGGVPALQKIEFIGKRVSRAAVNSFLAEHMTTLLNAEALRAAQQAQYQIVSPTEMPEGSRGLLTVTTKRFMSEGASPGGRNRALYFAACDYKNNLFTIEEALSALLPAAIELAALSPFEARQTIQSAFRRAPIRPRVAVEQKRKQ